MSKRKRVVLTFNDKINIIESLKNGESGRTLATKYGVGTSTISDIKKNTDAILKFTSKLNKDKSIHRKAMKKPNNEFLEEALYRWYLKKRSTGQPISGPVICKKALQLNKKISGNESFVASTGWLHRYKTRYGINDLQMQGRKISGNSVNSTEDSLREELVENEYDLDFVYNAAETSLYWKLLPSKAFVSWQKNSALTNETNEERVTLLVCANATGTHKVPLLLIGKLKNPICFKNIRIPLLYNHHHNACMDTEIFIDWYDSIFIPEIKKYQNQIGKHGNVLLLLNNTSIHSSAIFLERENGIFKVKLLYNMSQPMDSVIITLKRLYRKQLLRKLLSINDYNAEISFSFCKQMNLKECGYILVDAWDLIKKNILSKAWNTILKPEDRDSISNTDDSILEDVYKLISNIRLCEKCDADDIKAWLDCEITEQDFHLSSSSIISDDKIIENVLQIHEQKEIKEETEENLSAENNEVPSHVEAFHALETAFKWYERQTECDTVSLLQLKRILDVAAIKRKNDINCLYEVTIKKQIKLE